MNRDKRILVLIIVVAAALRLFALASDGLIGDEPAYSVRSIDYMDTLGTPLQSTPLDWFDEQSWWQKLSFHDHPPLVFALQHVSQRVFGQGVAQSRLPAALLDIGSVILLFYIVSHLFSSRAGFIASGLWAVNDFAIAYARSSMMESVALFFMLLSILFFLQALEQKKYMPFFGAALGFAILAKYTAAMMIPVFVCFIYKKRAPWKSAVLPLIFITSPVIIYNLMLYSVVGHFDVQLASLFGQETRWQLLLGKEQRGSIFERLMDMRSIFYYISPVLFIVMVQAVGWFFVDKEKRDNFGWCFTVLMFLSSLVFVWLADTAGRFFFYSTVFMVMLSAAFLSKIKWKFVVSGVIIFELLFSLNSVFAISHDGSFDVASVTYASAVKRKDYGIFALDEYIQNALSGNYSVYLPFNLSPAILQSVEENRLTAQAESRRLILIYDNTMGYQTYFWVFYKRVLQEGWPVLSSKQWKTLELDPAFVEKFTKGGELLYIHTTENTKRDENVSAEHATKVKDDFEAVSIVPDLITTKTGEIAFEVYSARYADVYGQ